VAEDVIGYEDLDDNGEWSDVPEYGHVWYPTTVSVGWTPYHYGHWGWVGAYGWTWIDDAPWGFAPFHYGRWAHIGNRWGWCPGPRSVRPYYAPALVAFIGGGVTISVGGPVGWFPLGPRDVYFPGYHVSRGYFTRVNVSNTIVNTTIINNYYGGYSRGSINYAEVNFRNRAVAGAVIAVPGAAFVGARPVNRAAISVGRDTFANARVTAFAPVAPTRASLVASTARPGRAPPARALDRRIVAATKPPPPVAPFAAREAVLRKNPGRPLTTREIRSLPAEQAGAGNAQAQRRANVKVVTNAGVPARTPAAPLAKRGEGNRGAAERGNADNARRAAAGTTQERPGRNPGGPDADKARAAPRGNAPEQRLRSSDFVRGNRGNPAQDNADNANARGARDNAAAQDARSTRANPAAEPPGRNARANPSESRPERQPADQGSNADRGQQRAAQAREQQAERQAQQRAQGQERAQQQRAEQAETQQQRRAQQQEEQQRERSQQAEAQQQRAQQQRSQQAEAQQQRAQQQRAQQAEAQQQRMQQQRAQQAEAQQERMQQQRAQQAEAQQQRMQQQRAQQAEAQQERAQQQRAQQAEAQQQRMQQQRAQQAEAQQQRAQQQRAQQPQQRNAPPQDRGNNERRGKKRDKDDDDDGGGR
jgi:hypothetical protein